MFVFAFFEKHDRIYFFEILRYEIDKVMSRVN